MTPTLIPRLSIDSHRFAASAAKAPLPAPHD